MELTCPNCHKGAWLLVTKPDARYYEPSTDQTQDPADNQNATPLEIPATRPKRQRAATDALEAEVRALLDAHPGLTGGEVMARTGAKQSTAYAILRKLKAQREPEAEELHSSVALLDDYVTVEALVGVVA